MTQREKDLELEEKRWLREKQLLEREQQLKEDKKSFRKKFHKKIPTSKWLIYFLFINCTLIELFTGWVTIKSLQLAAMTYILPDFTPLVTLIGAVVSEVIGFGVYSLKSAKENTTGGIVYETAMMNIKTSNNMANIPIDPNGVGWPLDSEIIFIISESFFCFYIVFFLKKWYNNYKRESFLRCFAKLNWFFQKNMI